MYLEDMARNLARINVLQLFVETVGDPGAYILTEAADINVQQLLDARYSDGSWTGEYSPFSEEYRKAKGLPYSKGIIFYDEGDFQSGIFAEVDSSGGLFLSSTDSKTDELVHTWSEDIFGLQDKNKTELTMEYILPNLQERIYNEITR